MHRQYRQIGAAAGLFAAQAGEPGLPAQSFQCAVHRLNLVDQVIFFDTFNALLPQFTVAGLLPGGRLLGTKHLQVQLQFVDQLIDKLIGFREQVAGIGEDHRNVRADLIHQM
ncbi:hypothetical protein D3C71_1848900 [compost metagenome]